MKAAIYAIALSILSSPSVAGEFQVDLAGIASQADVAAQVTIISGELIMSSDGELCGARYTAKVTEPIKGARTGELLTFGMYTGRSIGALPNIVFLARAGSSKGSVPWFSVSPGPHTSNEEKQRCESLTPPLLEMNEGTATLQTRYSDLPGFEGRPVVILNSTSFRIPATLKGRRSPRGFEAESEYIGTIEVDLPELIDFFKAKVPR